MAVGRIVAGIFILSSLAITESLKVQSNPDCTGVADFGKVEDPDNCPNYYTCYNGMAMNHPTPCPNGGTFSGGNCGPPSYPPCKPTRTGGGVGYCNVACTTGVSRVNHPWNCGFYYNCSSGVLGPFQQCPPNFPYFDSITNTCGTDPSVCCVFTCEPFCATKGFNIPDYYDSSQYYWCPAAGGPPSHQTCPIGAIYNISLGTCGPYSPWQSSCSAPPIPECLKNMTCTALGYYPKCNYCDPEYFFCEQVGKEAVLQMCSGVLLFSPTQHLCVLPTDCPLHPDVNHANDHLDKEMKDI